MAQGLVLLAARGAFAICKFAELLLSWNGTVADGPASVNPRHSWIGARVEFLRELYGVLGVLCDERLLRWLANQNT